MIFRLETFAFTFVGHLAPAEKEAVIDEVCQRLKVDMHDDESGWRVMYVRLRLVAWKD